MSLKYQPAGTASQLLSAAATSAASPTPEQTLNAAAQLALDALEWRRESRYATLEATQRQMDGFFSQLPPESGGICGILT